MCAFRSISIVGLGLIGSSVALAARRLRPRPRLAGIDCRSEVTAAAAARGIVDVATTDIAAAGESDLVILAAPVLANVALLPSVAACLRPGAIVTDTGSTKRTIVEEARRLSRELRRGEAGARLSFVGGHPLAGAAAGGMEAARADLFEGRKWVLTPEDDTPEDAVNNLSAFVTSLGAVPVTTTVAEHDRLLAVVSHLPQLAASALMHVAGEMAGEQGLSVAGAGLVDTTRLASSPPEIWKDIVLTNSDNIRPALARLAAVLSGLAADAGAEGDALERVFASARAWRDKCVVPTPGVPQGAGSDGA